MIHQQAGRGRLPPSHAPAQLVQLCQPETFGALDHDDAGVRHVDAHLDHRGGDQQLCLPLLKGTHGRVFIGGRHLPMNQPDHAFAQCRTQVFKPRLCGDQIADLAFFDQRAHPIALPPFADGGAQAGHDLLHPVGGNQGGADGFAPGRLFIQHRHVHIAILREGQRPRDRRRGHDQNIDGLPFFAKLKPLAHPKAVLFIHHRKAQIAKGDIGLKHRMGAHKDLDRAAFQRAQLGAPFGPFVASGQELKHHTRLFGQGAQAFKMLSRKDFCRGHEHALPACLNRPQQCHEGDQRFARAHIPLQQAVHARPAGHVFCNLGDGACLCTGGRIGQCAKHALLQVAIPNRLAPRLPPVLGARKGKRQLMGEQFIIGQPRPRWRRGRKVSHVVRGMRLLQRIWKIWPVLLVFLIRINPFADLWHPRQCGPRGLIHQLLRDPAGQRIDRFKRRNIARLGLGHDEIRVHHLGDAVKKLYPPRHHAP